MTIAKALVAAGLLALLVVSTGANGPRFFPDDPLRVDDDRAFDAGSVQPTRVVGLKDLVANTLRDIGDRRVVVAARRTAGS